jgi:hypothetical protein
MHVPRATQAAADQADLSSKPLSISVERFPVVTSKWSSKKKALQQSGPSGHLTPYAASEGGEDPMDMDSENTDDD